MEYCSGGTLDKYKDIISPLSESQIHHYMVCLRNGLKYLREKNILHRDLKPQNLLLTEDNVLKISDFGLSTSLENDRLTSTICGSPIYMAPEIIGSNIYGVKADLWSVGIIIYQLVYRKHPYVFTDVMQLIKEINTKKIKFPDADVSIRCIHLMTSLLQVQTENRISWGEYFVHPWFDQVSFNKSPYIVAQVSSTPSLSPLSPLSPHSPHSPLSPLSPLSQKDSSHNLSDNHNKSDIFDFSESSSQSLKEVTSCKNSGNSDRNNRINDRNDRNNVDRNTMVDTEKKKELSLQDFICNNYENSTEICRSAPVTMTDYTDSIKKIRARNNYFGSSKSIGKITRRTSCIIHDGIPSNTAPLNVRILPSKK